MLVSQTLGNQTIPAGSARYPAPAYVTLSGSAVCAPPMPFACTVSDLTVELNDAQPAGGSLVVTITNATTTNTLVLTIPANSAAGTYQNTTDTLAFSAGDVIEIEFQNNDGGAVSAQIVGFAFKTTGSSAAIFSGFINNVASGATAYYAFYGTTEGTEAGVSAPVPVAMTVTSFSVRTRLTNGDSTTTVTLRKNGVDTAFTVSYSSGEAASVKTSTGSVSFAAGDLITVSFSKAAGSTDAAAIGGTSIEATL